MTTLHVARPSADQKTPFYYGGIFFLAIKAMTFAIHEIRIGGHRLDWLAGSDISLLSWRLGKVAPTLFCVSFLVDAIVRKRKTIWFWAALLTGTVALTVYVVAFYKP